MIHIIQWMPYYPPHQWGLETHGQERAQHRVAANYGEVISIVSSIKQESRAHGSKQHQAMKNNFISFENHVIGYMDQWTEVLVVPAFDIISGFPVLRTWSKDYRRIKRYLEHKLSAERHTDKIIVQTRTRFFLSALLGWLRARHRKLPRVHIEHGSGFVKLSSKLSTAIAWLYDQTIGRWIVRHATALVPISGGVREFLVRMWAQDHKIAPVLYRGVDFKALARTDDLSSTIVLWFVGRLVTLKWVDLLIEVFARMLQDTSHDLQLRIAWSGAQQSQFQHLAHKLGIADKIVFFWQLAQDEVPAFLSQVDILVNPSFQEWLPTSVIEWLLAWCVVVASDAGGTAEASTAEDLLIVPVGDRSQLLSQLCYAVDQYQDLRGRSQDHVSAKFARAHTIQEYKEFYQWLEGWKSVSTSSSTR